MKIFFRLFNPRLHVTRMSSGESVFFPELLRWWIYGSILRYDVLDAAGGLIAMSWGVRRDYAKRAT
jgi:hypothetical protein